VSFRPVYLDSSAILKLILPEPESEALEDALQHWPHCLCSALAVVECRRTLRRVGAVAAVEKRADGVLKAMVHLHLDEPVLRLAARIGSPLLRSLDAIHLASALSLGDDPDAFITYDERLASAARKLKLRVVQPGR
jgi:predicted nucleic acid-binding protein